MRRAGWGLEAWSRAAIVAAGLVPAASEAALHVPIAVQQLVPGGVPGRARQDEPVSVGVPLASEDGITDAGQLGLAGADAAQFRVLQRDPETGRVRWVLVTFLADAPGGNYALVSGSGSFGGPALAVEDANSITVQTGAARFEVRKHGFNVIDRALRATSEVVPSHAGGGVVVLEGGTRYESGLDAASQVVLEENGPVMAVVRATGTLRSAAGATSLGYTVRLYFHKGRTSCLARVTLRNGELASLSAKSFDAAWVELPMRPASSRQVAFGFPGSGFAGTLANGAPAHLFQADNVFQRNARTAEITPLLTSATGLEVRIGAATHNLLGAATDVARGWMRLQDGGHAILAGMRDLAAFFPSGFDVQGDVLAVELFSRHNPQRGLVFSWGAHETRELLFELATPGTDPEPFRHRLQYPLAGRCDYTHYRDTGGLFGERRLVTVEEERRVFAEVGASWSPSDYAESDLELPRRVSFSTTGGGNQFDQNESDLIEFLRTGFAGRFAQGRLGVLFKADQAVLHSDDFDYGLRQNAISDVDVAQPTTFHGKGARNTFDDEHPHWVSMALYWLLTGDEHVREACVDYGEWRRYRAGHPTYGPIWGGGISHMRLWSRAFRDLALMYELTGESRYLDDVRRMAQVLVGTLETGTSRGRNLERGYFFFGDETDVNRYIHLFFLTEMNAVGTQQAWRVLPDDDPLAEELRDWFLGLAYFTLREAQISPDAIGYPYGYLAAVANPTPGTRGDQTGLQLAHGYEMTGDPAFVQRCRDLAWRVVVYQHPLRAVEIPTQVRLYRWLHRGETGALLIEPRATRNSDGTWTLRWPAPAGARAYIVKYGPKPLVENLDFDQMTRTFRVDPAGAMNFWAATNLAGEPAPGPAGTTETWRTPVLPAGAWYFKVKALLDRPAGPLASPDLPIGTPQLPGGDVGSSPAPSAPRPGAQRATDAGAEVGAVRPRIGPSPCRVRGGEGIAFAELPPHASLQLYDVAGRLVRRLGDRSGGGRLVWDRRSQTGTPVAPGVYLYRLDLGPDRTQRGRVILVP